MTYLTHLELTSGYRPSMRFSRPSNNNLIGWLILFGVWSSSFVYKLSPLEGFVFCTFKRLLDLPCPGCGLTRSFCSLSAGQPLTAFSDHLAGPFLYVAMVWVLFSGAMRCFDSKPERWTLSKRLVKLYWYAALVFLGLQVGETVDTWFTAQ